METDPASKTLSSVWNTEITLDKSGNPANMRTVQSRQQLLIRECCEYLELERGITRLEKTAH
jgi:hypothetical protein